MEQELDRLDKFLRQEGSETHPSTFHFFFSFIRRNVDLFGEEIIGKKFYDSIFEDYLRKHIEYSDEILENII